MFFNNIYFKVYESWSPDIEGIGTMKLTLPQSLPRWMGGLLVLVAGIVLAMFTHTSSASAATAMLKPGSSGTNVMLLQKALDYNRTRDYFAYPAAGIHTRTFGSTTQQGLKRWQHSHGYRATAKIAVGSSEWKQLMREAMSLSMPEGVDPRTVRIAKYGKYGVTVDGSKHTRVMHVVKRTRSGGVIISLTSRWRFGDARGPQYVTREGIQHIYRKGGRYYRSHSYTQGDGRGALMPYPAFFSGGEAWHYSADFAIYGYSRASHGCANLPTLAAAKYVHDLPMGTAVVIHQ